MKQEDISNALNLLQDDIIEETDQLRKSRQQTWESAIVKEAPKSKRLWWKLGSAAACLCIVFFGVKSMFTKDHTDKVIQQWSKQFSAADYFAYNEEASDEDEKADSIIPTYAQERRFSDSRSQMELDGVIPMLNDHPMFDCTAFYHADDTLAFLTLSWHRQGESYSDLRITAGYEKVEMIEDCIYVELDENGNILPPAVTVTWRDGIQITARGKENIKKTITFQNESGWYQIEGSWGDDYESVVALLDWVWEHPIDFSLFPIQLGDKFESTTLSQRPNSFQEYIPAFENFGFIEGGNYVLLKNGEEYRFEGHYIAHANEELVKNGNYISTDGWTEIHWCIDTDPDYYDRQDCLKTLYELTKQTVLDTLKEQGKISFWWNDHLIKIYTNTPEETWAVLETLIF